MNHFTSLFVLICLAVGLNAQPLSIDSTFQPFFDIRSGVGKGNISDLWEDPNTGKLYLVGDFKFTVNNVGHNGMSSVNRDGNRNSSFKGAVGGTFSRIIKRNKDTLLLTTNGHYLHRLFTGEEVKTRWRTNYRKTIICSAASEPYFFPDGSALMSNGLGNPGSCKIILPPDTFPHRYIVKIDPQGFWDSTFTPDANHHPRGFMPYDSKRIFVYGISKYFTHYDGVQVNGLCRIYLDGTLDTTFKTPLLSDTVEPKAFKIAKIENNGSFFITGDFILKEFPSQQHYLLKFHSDGMIDSSFRTNHNLKKNEIIIGINDIVSTPDNGYIITGFFDSIQGYPKHNIAKLDSMGKVEPQYFTTEGPDSSLHWGANYAGVRVLKSKFGGYYVYGDFAKWDGKPTQPIVRLKELTTSLEEKNQSTAEIEVFPNPSQAIFNVQSSLPIKQMMLFNLNGSQLNTINCNSNCSINLSNYSSGVYLLRLILNNGEIHHCKLIKH